MIHSIDISDGLRVTHPNDEGKLRGHHVFDLPVRLHVGDGASIGIREYLDSQCEWPLFFLDGDHSYEAVCRELALIHDEVPTAVMLLHDTDGEPGLAFQDFSALFPLAHRIAATEHGMISIWPE